MRSHRHKAIVSLLVLPALVARSGLDQRIQDQGLDLGGGGWMRSGVS